MNHEAQNIIATILSLSLGAFFIKGLVEGYINPKKHSFSEGLDRFDIGYVSETTKTTTTTPITVNINETSEPKVPAVPDKKVIDPALMKDAVSLLRSLGYTAADAKVEAKTVFENQPEDQPINDVNKFFEVFARK